MKDDTIKRSDAIKALRLEYPMMPMFKSLREEWAIKTEGFRKAEEVIMSVPSADRPQGEWKPKNHHTDYCSNCGFEETQWRTVDYNFCPSCGARMKGADDDSDNI